MNAGPGMVQGPLDTVGGGATRPRARPPRRRTARRWLGRNAPALFGGGVLLLAIGCAIFAPWLAPYGFNDNRGSDGVLFATQQAPSSAHWLGTTVGGTDVLSRVIFGA
ncbi:MAG TPA: hypothetical protein VFL91_17560, partial [Thermomicrobiales bacterium]|nr:hypothetical protein [Thermomicrobiales bacterium]